MPPHIFSPFSLQLLPSSSLYEFLPLLLSLLSSLSPARPWRHFTFTSHYTVWDDESAVYLSVSIQCCCCLQVRRRLGEHTHTHLSAQFHLTQMHTHTHNLLSICLSVPVSSLTHTPSNENMQPIFFNSKCPSQPLRIAWNESRVGTDSSPLIQLIRPRKPSKLFPSLSLVPCNKP